MALVPPYFVDLHTHDQWPKQSEFELKHDVQLGV